MGPLLFEPIFQQRIWGGRKLEQFYGKAIPAGLPIGESWEIADRPEAVSIVKNGPHQGQTLRSLMQSHGREILGKEGSEPFPLLIKILDAQQKLSLQVHPPENKCKALGGEPKTEMWYVAHAEPGAELFVGLKRGATREEFHQRLNNGTVAECFHRLSVRQGDAMFLPSGRVHAIGGGLVIFEVQQNSDTTYRVYDWVRVDDRGRPRQLHVKESLECIDFDDIEPALVSPVVEPFHGGVKKGLVDCRLFKVDYYRLDDGAFIQFGPGKMRIVSCLSGAIEVKTTEGTETLSTGTFVLLPAALQYSGLKAVGASEFLVILSGE